MVHALDTNTVIHLMRGSQSVRENRDRALRGGTRFVIPPLVHYEIWRGLIIKPLPSHEKAYAVICSNCSLEEMTAAIWERAAGIYAELYMKHLTVQDADILIAAFCLVNGYTLVTANTKDFEHIDGLNLEDWTQ